MKRHAIILALASLLLCGNALPLAAQDNTGTRRDFQLRFDKARELYLNGMYTSAAECFEEISQDSRWLGKASLANRSLVEGFRLLCKIKLGKADMEGAIREYESRYPSSALSSTIGFHHALHKFDSGDYAGANRILDKVDPASLSKGEREEYLFKRGYCHMRTGDHARAADLFYKIGSGRYQAPAMYYLGYIYYMNREFNSAIPLFGKAGKDPRFSGICSYYILESRFMLKDYRFVEEKGPEIYESLPNEYKARSARILSETYYTRNEPEKARHYYEVYSLNSKNISRNDHFYSGMVSYALGDCTPAIDAFSKVASTRDSIGQSAWYHMGQCYIQLKNKHKAQEAFYNASRTSYDLSVKEDAYFNYAKLTFDLNRNVKPFTEYLDTFPTTAVKWDEIHNYMAAAFLEGKKYDRAIDALVKIKVPQKNTNLYLQKALFLRGMELVESSAYGKAAPYFQEAAKHSWQTGNQQLGNLSDFWLAECRYRCGDYRGALDLLQGLQSSNSFRKAAEYGLLPYCKGYCHFMMQDFPAAIADFKAYLETPGPLSWAREARTRLADAHFRNRDYTQAAEIYSNIAASDNYSRLYAPLQASLAYGLIGNETEKLAILERITGPGHASAPLYTQALYELGRTHVQRSEDAQAQQVFDRLLNHPPDSTFYYKALLEMGMIHANRQDYDNALRYYGRIIRDKAISEEGESALAGMENIYQQQHRPEEFLSYLDRVGLSAVRTPTEKESMLFNSAEQIFLSGDYTKALHSLNSFLGKYPDGAHAQQAIFYKAECLSGLDRPEEAAQAYWKVMQNGSGAFVEVATLNYARISYQLQKYLDAAQAYESLEQIAQLGNNRQEGSSGKMRSLYHAGEYALAHEAAQAVLDARPQDRQLQREAKFILAKSLAYQGDTPQANRLFLELSKDPKDAFGAESAYTMILYAYDSGAFKEVEDKTFAFSDSGTPQTYWLAMSFIVLGDAYAERDNLEQARATFESIKENYDADHREEILKQVEKRLEKIRELTAEENK